MVQGVDTPLRRQSKIFIKAYTKNLAYGRHGCGQQHKYNNSKSCHMSPVYWLQPQQLQPQTLPLLYPSLCTIEWFFVVEKRKQIIETAKTQTYRCLPKSAIRSVTRGLQFIRNQGFQERIHQKEKGQKKLFSSVQLFWTIFEQNFSNPRPLLFKTLPHGIKKSIFFKPMNFFNGGKKRFQQDQGDLCQSLVC